MRCRHCQSASMVDSSNDKQTTIEPGRASDHRQGALTATRRDRSCRYRPVESLVIACTCGRGRASQTPESFICGKENKKIGKIVAGWLTEKEGVDACVVVVVSHQLISPRPPASHLKPRIRLGDRQPRTHLPSRPTFHSSFNHNTDLSL